MDLHDIRRDFHGQPMPEDLSEFNPWEQFEQWMADALRVGEPEPTAMTLCTVGPDGVPQGRVVLLKSFTQELVFYTSHLSAKAREIAANPNVSAVFWWPITMRQVRAVGVASRLAHEEAAEYFARRPRSSQLGAWASHQSAPLESRATFEEALERVTREFQDREIPCPPYWGGYRVAVTAFEFWQGQSGRTHDRLVTTLKAGSWHTHRIQP